VEEKRHFDPSFASEHKINEQHYNGAGEKASKVTETVRQVT